MTSGIVTNFRGLRALVVHRSDSNRTVLEDILGRLGLEVITLDPGHLTVDGSPDVDLVLFDADEDGFDPGDLSNLAEMPSIALIGNEAPSRLARVFRYQCDSHIQKPIRTSGVFTAVLLAVNGHQRSQRSADQLETMRQRLAGRRTVMKAVLSMMSEQGIDEDAAYERLRRGAMHRRIPIEEMARESLGPDGTSNPLSPEARISRKA
ncbi:MAG: ANTAR domain-containing protein [Rhodobacteraceae bacterium]|nr:ANTAR domain-containing protein [Paracoccaceae bacterium]